MKNEKQTKTNKKSEAFYIVYEIQKNDNGEIVDFKNINDFDTLKQATDFISIDYSNASKYVINDLNDVEKIRIKKEFNIQYIIFKDSTI